jgi:hypothetical protein
MDAIKATEALHVLHKTRDAVEGLNGPRCPRGGKRK